MSDISPSAHDWLNTALAVLALLAPFAVAAITGRPARLLYSASSWQVPADWRNPAPRRRRVAFGVYNHSGRGLLWMRGQGFHARDFDSDMRVPVRAGWFVAEDAAGRAYPNGRPQDAQARRGASVAIPLPHLPKGASHEATFLLEEIQDLPKGQRLLRWLRDLRAFDPIGKPCVDSAAVAGFRKRPGPAALFYVSLVPLAGAAALLDFAAPAAPGAETLLVAGALVLMAGAVGLAARALLAVVPDVRTQISLARRHGVATVAPGLTGPGPGPDIVPLMLIVAGAYYRWIGNVSDAVPQSPAASWLAFALALAWLMARSAVVWRRAPARP